MKHNNIKISPQLTIEQRFAELLKQNNKKSATIHPQIENNETILKSTQKILATLENTGFKYRWYHNIYETKSIKEAKNFLKSIASERPEIITNIADLKEITSRYKFNKFDDKLFFASKYIESQEKSKQETQVKPKIVTNIEFAEILDTLKINDSEERFNATLKIIDKNKFSYINREDFLNNDFDKIINKNDDILNFKKLQIAKKFIQNSPKNNENSDLSTFIDFINQTTIYGRNKLYHLKENLSEFLNTKTDQNKNLILSDNNISSLINDIKINDININKDFQTLIATQILQRQINDDIMVDAKDGATKILKVINLIDNKELILSINELKKITESAFVNYQGTTKYSMIKEVRKIIYLRFEKSILKDNEIITAKEIDIAKIYLPNFNQETQLISLLDLSNKLTAGAKPIEKASDEIIDKIEIKDIDNQKQEALKDILKKFLKDKNIKDKDIETLKTIFDAKIETGNFSKFKDFMIKNIDKVCFLFSQDKEESFNKFNGIITTLNDGCGANISNQLNLVINSLNTQNNNDDDKYAEPIRLITAEIIGKLIIPLTHNSGIDTLGANPTANLMKEPFLDRYFITPNSLFNKILSIVIYGKNIDLIDKEEYSAIKNYIGEKYEDDYSKIETETKKLIAFELMKEIFNDPKQQPEKQNSKFDSLIPKSSKLKEVQQTIEEANQQKEKENLAKDQEITPNNNINPSSSVFNCHEKLVATLREQGMTIKH